MSSRAREAKSGFSYTTDLASATMECDLVSESVPENPDLKRKVFNELNDRCPAHTIFTSNSSSLLPSQIADGTGRPERFLAMHFANRIWVVNVGEVMKHPGTDPEVFERVLKFAAEIGMVPIRIEEEQISDHWATVTGDPQKRKNADYLKENYLDNGKLGVKSGEGFYKYPDPEFARPDFLK